MCTDSRGRVKLVVYFNVIINNTTILEDAMRPLAFVTSRKGRDEVSAFIIAPMPDHYSF